MKKILKQFLSGFLATLILAGILAAYVINVKLPYWQSLEAQQYFILVPNTSTSHSF